jgi:hypothetical protein
MGQGVSQSSCTRAILAGENRRTVGAETSHSDRNPGCRFTGVQAEFGSLDHLGILRPTEDGIRCLEFDPQPCSDNVARLIFIADERPIISKRGKPVGQDQDNTCTQIKVVPIWGIVLEAEGRAV